MSDEDRRRGAYAPPPEDYDTFDARQGGGDRRGLILLAAAAAVFALFVVVVWSAYNQGVRDRDSAPILTADSEPYRRAPIDPGGFETPGQDIEAYSLREGARPGETEGEDGERAVRPGPEEPLAPPVGLPPVTIETADADEVGAGDEADTDPPLEIETIEEPEARPAPEEARAEPEPSRPAQSADPLGDLLRQTEQDRGAPTRLAEAPAEREPEPAREERPAPAPSASGDFVVQIAAFRSRAEADEAWRSFQSRFPDLASGRLASIIEDDLGDRGVYHRLRIAGFSSRDEATRYCSTLSGRGQDCLVAGR
jgi:cell division septation protein DedD